MKFLKSRHQTLAAYAAPSHFWGGRGGSLVFLTGAMFLLLVSFARPGSLGGLRIGAADFVAPLLDAISRPFQDAASMVSGVSGIAELRAENKRLSAENVRLREWYQSALMLQAENKSLQELLNLKVEPGHKFITTRVIADSGSAYVHSALVAAGKKDGVDKGQAVLAGEGMVGRIIEAGKNSARVLLLTDFNSRVPVLIEGSSQKAILSGTNEDKAVLRYLPPDGEVMDGARIVTSGHGGLFPRGLPVGRVMLGADGTPYVKPFADMSRVTYVRVLERSEDPNLRKGPLSETVITGH